MFSDNSGEFYDSPRMKNGLQNYTLPLHITAGDTIRVAPQHVLEVVNQKAFLFNKESEEDNLPVTNITLTKSYR